MRHAPLLIALVLITLALPGCKGTETDDGPTTVARIDETHTLGSPIIVDNLTVWPVFTDEPLDVGEFLTLEEAILKGTAVVREKGGAAEVNELVIENKGDLPILVCAGTIVTGGKQDRQIGEDIVIASATTVPVEAFCVEQGRWTNVRGNAETDGVFQVATMNALQPVRAKGQYLKDQSGVWEEVAQVKGKVVANVSLFGLADISGLDETTSLAVALEGNGKVSKEKLDAIEKQVREHFASLGGTENAPVGFAYAIDGKVVTVRAFAHERVFNKQFAPFLKSMCTEAFLAAQEEGRKTPPAAKPEDVVALVTEINKAQEEILATAAANDNGVRKNDTGYNGNCYFKDEDGKRIRLTSDWTRR